jgi:hypothetical protein
VWLPVVLQSAERRAHAGQELVAGQLARQNKERVSAGMLTAEGGTAVPARGGRRAADLRNAEAFGCAGETNYEGSKVEHTVEIQ